MSTSCSKKRSKCAALIALEKAGNSAIDKTQGGASPGAEMCLSLSGSLLLARDETRNEIALCTFGDKSWIEPGALLRAAIDRKSELR